MNKLFEVYTDGGVIGRNPSPVGGTWAFCFVEADQRVREESGVIPGDELSQITNNMTELFAILKALEALPDGARAHVHSDSQVSLGRVFSGWRLKNVPAYMRFMLERERARFKAFEGFTVTLLEGHPSSSELARGFGENHPVSQHNVWCDHACTEAGRKFREEVAK